MKRAGKKAEDDAAVQIAAKQDAFDQLNTLYAEQVCTYMCECYQKPALVQHSDRSEEEYHFHRVIILLIIMIMITVNKINQTKYNRENSVFHQMITFLSRTFRFFLQIIIYLMIIHFI